MMHTMRINLHYSHTNITKKTYVENTRLKKFKLWTSTQLKDISPEE